MSQNWRVKVKTYNSVIGDIYIYFIVLVHNGENVVDKLKDSPFWNDADEIVSVGVVEDVYYLNTF